MQNTQHNFDSLSTYKSESVECGSLRQHKHIELRNAIDSINTISLHLGELIERLEGSGPSASVNMSGNPEPDPTFIEVLDGGPNHIREITKRIHEQIDYITNLLF